MVYTDDDNDPFVFETNPDQWIHQSTNPPQNVEFSVQLLLYGAGTCWVCADVSVDVGVYIVEILVTA